MLKKLPTLTSDEEAEAFLDSADLSEYDLSEMKPAEFEYLQKSAKLNMRLPESLLAAIKAKADAQGYRTNVTSDRYLRPMSGPRGFAYRPSGEMMSPSCPDGGRR